MLSKRPACFLILEKNKAYFNPPNVHIIANSFNLACGEEL